MKIAVTSDMHGINLPEIPEVDVCVIAGDLLPDGDSLRQRFYLRTAFSLWVKDIPARYVIAVGGNHDFVLQTDEGIKEMMRIEHSCDRFIYLQDETVLLSELGLKVHGSPWVPDLSGWAFSENDYALDKYWHKIPKDVNLLITHGPALGVGDRTSWTHAGSVTLKSKLWNLLDLKVHAFGHIHEGYGITENAYHGGKFVNGAHTDRMYKPVNAPIVVEI